MPLQNRVAPDGKLLATSARGEMLGNRGGKFHKPDQTLGKRRWATHHWICCELHYKNVHHEPMGQGYTSLFFLDEVTALAAGHRPCGYCRRTEMKAFLGAMKVEDFDRQLHRERLSPRQQMFTDDLPDGAMVQRGEAFFAKRDHAFLRWSFDGYADKQSFSNQTLLLLTPPSIIGILRNGYQPRWHISASNWDDTK
jgi:hypothetical protein